VPKILVADDEALIRRLVGDFLKKSGYDVIEAADGKEAVLKFRETKDISLVVCDIMMPEMDGWEVCREIRRTSNVPIIVLTARTQEFDELVSFESGADDFVTKPFSPTVLVKRIEALLKRAARETHSISSDAITIDGLVLNTAAHTVTLSGRELELTIKEYGILERLMRNPERLFSRDKLLDDIWGVDFEGDPRTVDSHVARLRVKLGEWGELHLKTVYGAGYKIEVKRN
jgi:DNA-binding response OmpR family regulator